MKYKISIFLAAFIYTFTINAQQSNTEDSKQNTNGIFTGISAADLRQNITQFTEGNPALFMAKDQAYTFNLYKTNIQLCGTELHNGTSETFSWEQNFNVNTEGQGNVFNEAQVAIKYTNIFEGIDLRVFFYNGALKEEFIVHPGGQVGDIAFELSDPIANAFSNQLTLSSVDGNYEILATGLQWNNGTQETVPILFELNGNQISFQVAGSWDVSQSLLIHLDIPIVETVVAGKALKQGNCEQQLTTTVESDAFVFYPTIEAYPNPWSTGNLKVNIRELSAAGLFQLTDVLGREIFRQQIIPNAGQTQFEIPAETITGNGIYFTQLYIDGALQESHKIIAGQ